MKAVQRKSLWINTAFSIVMGALIVGIIVVRRDLPTLFVALLIAAYVLGNVYIHFRRNDLNKETVFEYILVAVAVFIVLASALTH